MSRSISRVLIDDVVKLPDARCCSRQHIDIAFHVLRCDPLHRKRVSRRISASLTGNMDYNKSRGPIRGSASIRNSLWPRWVQQRRPSPRRHRRRSRPPRRHPPRRRRRRRSSIWTVAGFTSGIVRTFVSPSRPARERSRGGRSTQGGIVQMPHSPRRRRSIACPPRPPGRRGRFVLASPPPQIPYDRDCEGGADSALSM